MGENSQAQLILKAGGAISLLIEGVKERKGGKWIIYEHLGDIEIFDSYFRFSSHSAYKSDNLSEGYVNHMGIIPFEGIIPVKDYRKKFKKTYKQRKLTFLEYFLVLDVLNRAYVSFRFDYTFGWQNIPLYMHEYSGRRVAQLNTQLITSLEEYQQALNTSFVGPNIGVSFGFDKKINDKTFTDQLSSTFEALQIKNPPHKRMGEIRVKFQEFQNP